MQCTGILKEPSIDFTTGKLILAVQVNEDVREQYNKLSGCDLDIKIVKHRKKRSLDANAYAWVLMSKIAQKLGTSKDEVYEDALRKYPIPFESENGYVVISIKSEIDISMLPGHWMMIKDNGQFKGYMMLKGSSEYDTREMARFIDGIIYDAKELGIQTETPDEIERMKAMWGQDGQKIT